MAKPILLDIFSVNRGLKSDEFKSIAPKLLSDSVGKVENIGTRLGQLMAVSDITTLNGHFFQRDLNYAERDSRDNGWFDRMRSKVYGPAMERYQQVVESKPELASKHRILVFNGCESEDFVLIEQDIAQPTAPSALVNSTKKPSPIVLTNVPRC